VLDRHGAVVARPAQGAQQLGPRGGVVASADGAEMPRHRVGVRRPAEVEDAVARDAVRVHDRVLAMGEADGAVELVDDRHRVHALPPEVRGIEVDRERAADRVGQQPERPGVVDRGARVQLQADAHARRLAGGELGEVVPVRRDRVLPLPLPQALHVGQPRAAGEHRPGRVARPAGTAAHRHDAIATEHDGQAQRVTQRGVVLGSDVAARVQWVAGGVEGGELNPCVGQPREQPPARGAVAQEPGAVDVRGRRVAADTQLDDGQLVCGAPVQRVVEPEMREAIGEKAES
jgi:hypothetical protein